MLMQATSGRWVDVPTNSANYDGTPYTALWDTARNDFVLGGGGNPRSVEQADIDALDTAFWNPPAPSVPDPKGLTRLSPEQVANFNSGSNSFNPGYTNPFPGQTVWSGGNLAAQLGINADPNFLYAAPVDASHFRTNAGGGNESWEDMTKDFFDPKGYAGIIYTALAAGALGGAGVGAESAGAAGTGGGAAATGVDASTGLFAGESANAGAGAFGATGGGATMSGGAGAGSLMGGAGSDTLSSMPAAQAEPDTMGGYNIDPNTGDVYYGTGDNPFGSNFSGGDTNAFFKGTEGISGLDPSALQQVKDFATQYGLTAANALKMLQSAGGASGILGALGRGIPGVIGAIGANQQANSLSAIADKYMALGAPSRARYEASFQPGFSMANEPGYADALDQTTKSFLHKASMSGNPAASPNAWEQTLKDVNSSFAFPALQNFRNMNSNAGGISSLQTAAPAAATGAIGAQGNIFNALGDSAASIFNPPKSLAEQLAELRKQGLY